MPERKASTALRVASLYSLSFAIVTALVGAATWYFTDTALRHSLDERLSDELVALEHADVEEGREALIGDIVAFDAIPGHGRYLLNGPDGERLAGRVRVTSVPLGIGNSTVVRSVGGTEPVRVVSKDLTDGSRLAVIGELGLMRRTERTLLAIAGAGFGVVIVIGVIGGILSGRVLQRKLSRVDATARAIIAGDFSRRMPTGPNNDEFDQLARTLNAMLDHIERLMGSLRHVSADVAHDLRSPLGRLRARLDSILALFGTILRISEVEAKGVRRLFGRVALAPLVSEIVEGIAPAAQDEGRSLAIGALEELDVAGSRDLIGQALTNLIENAMRHTPEGTRIEVNLARTAEGPVLEVRDDGPGIPADQHATVLQRFGRLDRSRSTPGHGLGLTMVETVAAAHGARLELADGGPGLVARLVFASEV